MKDNWIVCNMAEVETDSTGLLVVAPPYNIGTAYGDNPDRMPIDDYIKMMRRVIGECVRVLSSKGTLFLEVADSVLMEGGVYVQLAGMLQDMVLDAGLYLIFRHISFVHTENGIELPEDERWEGYMTKNCAHSNCHQWLVFSKTEKRFRGGRIFYFDYVETKNHPCPFSDELCKFILDRYLVFSPVVEPFAGTANLGRHVLNRGGQYIGYEIDKWIYRHAVQQLASL